MNFDLKQGTWGGDWPEALAISQRWQQQDKAANKELTFLLFSCPHRLREHLERGRGNLEWKDTVSHYVAQAGLELLGSSDPPALVS
ncbi:FCGRT isoform 3 [Pan troglodytes]|nr:FCGRT isoform 3 [Pan troglodytes]